MRGEAGGKDDEGREKAIQMRGRVIFLRCKERSVGWETQSTHKKKLVICRVKRTRMHQTAQGDGDGFVKCRERCGLLLRLPLPRTS